jgi:nicotinamide-nucleotide amidase
MAMLPNPNGTAPGLAGRIGSCLVFALPGPPREMRPMFLDHVAPALPSPPDDEQIRWGTVECFGIGESSAAERLGELLDRGRNPLVGITATGGVLTIRAHVAGARRDADRLLEETLADVEARLSPYAYARDGEPLPSVILRLLRERGQRLVVAESCTGGLLGSMLVDVPGSSDAFDGGWITYTNEAKIRDLGVPAELIEAHGAVSDEVARAMADGARSNAAADLALSITGVAGPDGGTAGKPVGLVHIGLSGPRGDAQNAAPPFARPFKFSGERRRIREISARAALQILRFRLLGIPDDQPMLWQWEAP